MRKLGCPAPSMMRRWAACIRADAVVGEGSGGEGGRGAALRARGGVEDVSLWAWLLVPRLRRRSQGCCGGRDDRGLGWRRQCLRTVRPVTKAASALSGCWPTKKGRHWTLLGPARLCNPEQSLEILLLFLFLAAAGAVDAC